MTWLFVIFNLLGISIYFLVRFANRTDKTLSFSAAFWLGDNWVETIGTLLMNILLFLAFYFKGVSFDLAKLAPWLPSGISIIGDLVFYALIGGFISHLVYEAFRTKTKK